MLEHIQEILHLWRDDQAYRIITSFGHSFPRPPYEVDHDLKVLADRIDTICRNEALRLASTFITERLDKWHRKQVNFARALVLSLAINIILFWLLLETLK